MMRTIDADRLLMALGEEPERMDTDIELHSVVDYRWFKTLIEEAPTVDPWIPVEDELPPPRIEVEVTCESHFPDEEVYRYTKRAMYEDGKMHQGVGWVTLLGWIDEEDETVVAWRRVAEPWRG